MNVSLRLRQGVKLLIACLLPVITVSVAHSQLNYSLAITNPGYASNASPTVIIPASTDEALSGVQNIGFTFTYNCNTYTQFVASSNGWMSLGAAATQPLPGNALGTTGIGPVLAPLWDNLATDATGNVNYQLTGAPGSQVLTVEWFNMRWDASSLTPVMLFEVKLHEGTNLVEFAYQRYAPAGTITNGSASIGINSGNSATDFYSLTDAQLGPAVYASETTNLKAKPFGGRLYTWTEGSMAYQSSTVTQLANGLISACTPTQPVAGIQVVTNGCASPLSLTQLQFSMNGSTNPADFSKIHIYYTGNSAVYNPSSEFVAGGITPTTGTITANGSQALMPGTNYFWIAYDVNVGTAIPGNTIDAECTQMTIGALPQTPAITAPAGSGTFTSCSVSPGGISGMAFWIKTTNGVPVTTDGSPIATWNDQSGNVRTASSPGSANNPTYRDNSSSNVNFNPVVEFDAASQNPVSADYLTIGANGLLAAGNNNYSVYAVIKPGTGNTATPGKFLFAGTAGTSTYSAFGIGATNSFADSWSSNDLVVNNAWSAGTPALASFSYDGSQRNMYAGGNLAGSLGGAGTRNSADVNDAIGARNDGSASEFFSGSIAEIVTYPNTVHPAAARNKIETYLAIKYGISLQHDYVSSAGTTIWNMATNASYNSNITGIGRDDNSGLNQKQGRSGSALADMLTVYIGGSKTVNQAANTGNFTAGDQSFFMIGNNNTVFAYAGGGTTEKPSGISTRLQREWLVQKTNFTNTDITLEFDMSVASAGFSSATFHAADLRLLLDNDGNFSNATIVSSPAASFTVNGSVLTVTLPAASFGATTYVTLASASTATSLPVLLSGFNAACKNNKVQLSWTKQSTAASTYHIERSNDGHSFAPVAVMSSYTSGEQFLSWTDLSPLPGISYYRLQVVDENGAASYSSVAGVNSCSGGESTRIVSDAVTGQPSLVIQLQQSASVNINLYDVLGHRIDIGGLTGKHAMQQGFYRLPVTQQGLASGLYLLSVSINGHNNVYRIVQP